METKDNSASRAAERKKQARRERIAAIKAELEAGTYVIDAAELSRKMVDAHLAKKTPS